MGNTTIIGSDVSNIPWQDRPASYPGVIWRHSENPIVEPEAFPRAIGVYNCSVIDYKGKFVGVFRVDEDDRMAHLHMARSDDGLKWDIEFERVNFACDDPDIAAMEYSYDPRITLIDGTYYIAWCNSFNGAAVAMAKTKDFETFERMEYAFIPHNRDAVLFPRKINGRYAMLTRPCGPGHSPFGSMFYSESPDLTYWGRHRYVMGPGGQWWQNTKVGAGPPPIETTEGWLLFYHGVMNYCNGFCYSVGAVLLDIDQPWKVMYRTNVQILTPHYDYETCGVVTNVCFPCGVLSDAVTGRIAIYYGAADKYMAVAYTQVDELIDFIKSHSEVF